MSNHINQIDAMLALCARATEGPWDVETDGDGGEFGPEDEWPWRIKGVCNFSEEGGDEHDAAFIAASRTGWEATLRALKVAVPIIEAEIDKRKRDILSLRTMGRGTDLAESTAADLELDLKRLERALATIAKELEATQ